MEGMKCFVGERMRERKEHENSRKRKGRCDEWRKGSSGKDFVEGTRLVRVAGVEIGNGFVGVLEFDSGDPVELLVGTVVSGPLDVVKERALPASAVDPRVNNHVDLVLEFAVDFDWRRRIGCPAGDVARNKRFEHRDVVYRMNAAELLRKGERVGLRANLSDDLVRSKGLLGELGGRTGCSEELRLDEDFVTDLNIQRRSPARVSRSLITTLGLGNLLPKLGMQLLQVNDEISGFCGSKVAFRMDRPVRMIALVREERRNAGSSAGSVVVRELGERKEFGPIVLLVVAIHPKVLLESLVGTLGLTVGFRVVTGSEVQTHVQSLSEGAEEARDEFRTTVGSNV